MIAIVDYNCGNIGSVKKMIEKSGGKAIITNHLEDINKAEKIILPGVGAFDTGMTNIKDFNLLESLNENILVKKKPILGICLGMQLMTLKSEEGKLNGLSWINAEVKKFPAGADIKVPKIGWDYITIQKDNPLFNNYQENPRFYFVHSYFVESQDETIITARSKYHHIDYTSAFNKDNIYGVQFHPEKSHKFGMQLLKNFLAI
jgi:glutamine amidotransferase